MEFPQIYRARAEANSDNGVDVTSGGLPLLTTAPPAELGGPGDRWSPETLTVAAVGDCLVLTFKAIAKTRAFPFTRIICDVEGKLDRIDRVTSFTEFEVNVRLDLPESASIEEARRLLELSKRHCLITNSLKGSVNFDVTISLDSKVTLEERLTKAS